jgi:hypothetical protein
VRCRITLLPLVLDNNKQNLLRQQHLLLLLPHPFTNCRMYSVAKLQDIRYPPSIDFTQTSYMRINKSHSLLLFIHHESLPKYHAVILQPHHHKHSLISILCSDDQAHPSHPHIIESFILPLPFRYHCSEVRRCIAPQIRNGHSHGSPHLVLNHSIKS